MIAVKTYQVLGIKRSLAVRKQQGFPSGTSHRKRYHQIFRKIRLKKVFEKFFLSFYLN